MKEKESEVMLPSRIRTLQTDVEYSSDGKYVFQPQGKEVRVFNVKSGDSSFTLDGKHQDKVTAVAAVLGNPLQVYTCGLDGKVFLWDYMEGMVLKAFDIKHPILWMAACTDTDSIIVVIDNSTPKRLSWRLVIYSLREMKTIRVLVKEATTKFTRAVSVGSYVAIIFGYTLALFSPYQDRKKLVRRTHDDILTAVAIHPNSSCVAVGDVVGRIHTWYGLSDGASCTTLHWHAHKVHALTFTPDGSLLLSGGEENVLTSWQLDSGKRDFLPRLGAALRSIRVSDGNSTAICLSDNSLLLVNSTDLTLLWKHRYLLEEKTSVRRGQKSLNPYTALANGVMSDPTNGTILLAGNNADNGPVLYFVSPTENNVKSSLHTSGRNQSGGTPEGIPYLDALHFATLSEDGQALLTSDKRNTVRFFRRSFTSSFELEAVVPESHKGSKITSVCSHPTNEAFLTAASNGSFKLWCTEQGSWRCAYVGQTSAKPIRGASFSSDGSVLALAARQQLNLWDISSSPPRMLGNLLLPGNDEHLRGLKFLGMSADIVAWSSKAVYVWDTATRALKWSYGGRIVAVAVGDLRKDGHIALFVGEKKDTVMLVFGQSAIPLRKKVFKDFAVKSATIFGGKVVCVGVTGTLLTETLGGDKGSDKGVSVKHQQEQEDVDVIGRMFVDRTGKHISDTNFVSSKRPREGEKMLCLPSHLLPPLVCVYTKFLEATLEKAVKGNEKKVEQETETEAETAIEPQRKKARLELMHGGLKLEKMAIKEASDQQLRGSTYKSLVALFSKA